MNRLSGLTVTQFLVSPLVCGVRGRENRIVGGKETAPNEFPWIVGLQRQGKLYCSATLITNKHLLTAAHCVDSFDAHEIRVFLGGHNITSDYTELRRVRKIRSHENFDIFTFNNDIAVVELDKPVKFGPTIQPACLPDGGRISSLRCLLNEKDINMGLDFRICIFIYINLSSENSVRFGERDFFLQITLNLQNHVSIAKGTFYLGNVAIIPFCFNNAI